MKCAICKNKLFFFQKKRRLFFSGKVHENCYKEFCNKGVIAQINIDGNEFYSIDSFSS